jgi:hypothetical protein
MTRIHLKARGALMPVILLMLTLLSCNRETATAPGAPKTDPDASEVGPLAARAIALAMAEPQIRQQILGDMRESPFSEHKLVLQDYFATTAGARVLDAIQRAGIDSDRLRSALQDAHRIQFYVLSTEQRSSWTGTGGVMVVPHLTRDLSTIGFQPTGEAASIDLAKGTMPGGVSALFVLQWAEPMFHRWSGPTKATETIQEPGESQLGSGRVVRDASGQVISTTDDTPFGSSRPAASAAFDEPAGTYLTRLSNDNGVGDGASGDHLEFEFRSSASDNPTTYVSSQLTGIPTDAGAVWQGWWQIHTSRVHSPVTMEVQVWEIDDTSPDDAFYCALGQDPTPCTPGTTPWPYLTDPYGFYGPWSFGLCEDDPAVCVHPWGEFDPDISVTFTDRATPVATTVNVSPQNATISKSATQDYTAQVFDQYGGLMTNQVATWTSLNTSVATVVSTGNMSARATGVGGYQTTIQATVDGVSRNATLNVLAPATVTLSPSSISICSNGGQGYLTATVKDQNGTVWTPGSVAWSSSNTSAATVAVYDPRTGRVTGGAVGSATITGTIDGVSGPSSVTVGTCLAPPTSCTIAWISGPRYLRVAWANGDASASTEVDINANGNWSNVGTAAPGITQYFYIVGSQHGLFYARVRHVKSGYLPSSYCNTGSTTVP